MSEVSVVVSLYNEEENIKPLIEAIDASLGGLDYGFFSLMTVPQIGPFLR